MHRFATQLRRRFPLTILIAISLCSLAESASAAIVVVDSQVFGPSTIPCGSSAEYTVKIQISSIDVGTWFHWTIYDEDGGERMPDPDQGFLDTDLDDLLVSEKTTWLPADTPLNTWITVDKFTLHCQACILAGPDGSSGENTAEVYPLIESDLGVDLHVGEITPVRCVIPEASTSVLLVLPAGLSLFSRRVARIGATRNEPR